MSHASTSHGQAPRCWHMAHQAGLLGAQCTCSPGRKLQCLYVGAHRQLLPEWCPARHQRKSKHATLERRRGAQSVTADCCRRTQLVCKWLAADKKPPVVSHERIRYQTSKLNTCGHPPSSKSLSCGLGRLRQQNSARAFMSIGQS